MSTATYNITGDSGINFFKKFKVFHNFHQVFNGASYKFHLYE